MGVDRAEKGSTAVLGGGGIRLINLGFSFFLMLDYISQQTLILGDQKKPKKRSKKLTSHEKLRNLLQMALEVHSQCVCVHDFFSFDV